MFEIVKTGTAAAPIYASTPTTLVSFNGTNGAQPYGSLIADANGDLFGTTAGRRRCSATARCSRSSRPALLCPGYASTPTTLVSFNVTDGADPIGGLIVDANGDLFGTTENGGAYGRGHSVRNRQDCHRLRQTPTTVINLQRHQRWRSFGDLIADANGDLFGTTAIRRAHTAQYSRSPAAASSWPRADCRGGHGTCVCRWDGHRDCSARRAGE